MYYSRGESRDCGSAGRINPQCTIYALHYRHHATDINIKKIESNYLAKVNRRKTTNIKSENKYLIEKSRILQGGVIFTDLTMFYERSVTFAL